ncbi:MAG: hypothetical protein HC915_13015 [Anaerolineae bacterium]|nr:hypothetical protein [Anaerolineae bacterium]
MQNKLRQLIISALKRNEFTSHLPLSIKLQGYQVVVYGSVPAEELIYEVVATVESVSPYLQVRSQMQVERAAPLSLR